MTSPLLIFINIPIVAVAVVQLVERQIVILVVVGSSPISHPILHFIKQPPKIMKKIKFQKRKYLDR